MPLTLRRQHQNCHALSPTTVCCVLQTWTAALVIAHAMHCQQHAACCVLPYRVMEAHGQRPVAAASPNGPSAAEGDCLCGCYSRHAAGWRSCPAGCPKPAGADCILTLPAVHPTVGCTELTRRCIGRGLGWSGEPSVSLAFTLSLTLPCTHGPMEGP